MTAEQEPTYEWHLDEYGDLEWDDNLPTLNAEQLALYLDTSESTAQQALDKLVEMHMDAENWRKLNAYITALDPMMVATMTLQDRDTGEQFKVEVTRPVSRLF